MSWITNCDAAKWQLFPNKVWIIKLCFTRNSHFTSHAHSTCAWALNNVNSLQAPRIKQLFTDMWWVIIIIQFEESKAKATEIKKSIVCGFCAHLLLAFYSHLGERANSLFLSQFTAKEKTSSCLCTLCFPCWFKCIQLFCVIQWCMSSYCCNRALRL